MAADAKTLKNRMNVVTTIQKVTKSMKVVAAAKLVHAQRALPPAREFAAPLLNVWSGPSKQKIASRAVVVISSDRGLCGGLNGGVNRRAKALLTEANIKRLTSPPYSVFPIGNKARNAMERYFASSYIGTITDYARIKLGFRQVALMASDLLAAKQDEYVMIYNRFKNVISCEAKEEVLYGFEAALQADDELSKFEIENGGMTDVAQNLHEFRFACRFYLMFAESYVSEVSSRMNAMNNSSKAAGDMLRALSMLYNRTRQEKITRELIEIVSGAVAMDEADAN